MDYCINQKYPKPMVEAKNLRYAALLKEDYAGSTSELTAIMLYTFQHISKFALWEEYAYLLHKISIVEMHHLQLLGETIVLLGDTAEYSINHNQSDTKIPWTSSYVSSSTDLKHMVELDIKSELGAIKQYEEHLIQIDDHYIQNLLLRIIEDEKLHLEIFTTFYQKHFGGNSK